MASAKEVALVIASKSGVSKKNRDYSLLEVCLLKHASIATVFADEQGAFSGVEKGHIVEVNIDTSNPMSPRLSYVGRVAGHVEVVK